MFSFLILFISSLIILFPKEDKIREKIIYAVIFSSFIFTSLLLGFISLILITLGISKFPVLIISLFILFITLFNDRNSLNKLIKIKTFLNIEKNNFLNNVYLGKIQKFYINIVILFLILILISSIGPINHPDAADYHVGYPFQYFLKGKFFNDGGLHQGLLGLADYANLAFIQEKTVWFIRFIQIINLPILIIFLSTRIKNNLYLIAFLSVPTFIQWSTIGKPLFLGESSLIVVYIIWKYYKNQSTLKILLISIIGCISFKISSIIVIFPIFLDILFNLFTSSEKKNKLYSIYKYLIVSKEFLITLIALLTLLIKRSIITGNFAYPLLTNIFNRNDEIVRNFSTFLSSYERGNLFAIKIFLPTNLSELGTSLGPSILILCILLFYKNFKFKKDFKFFFFNNTNLISICFIQFILLILFCQGRADYYVAPLILLIYQSDQLLDSINNSSLNFIFYISTFFQISIISSFLFFSIYSNFLTFTNYEKIMNKTAFGFNLSKQINKKISGNFLIKSRNMRLYYPENYLEKDKMQRCIIEEGLSFRSGPEELCLNKYNINQIITSNDDLIDENNFICKIVNSEIVSRNIFKRKEYIYKYCKRIDLTE